MADPVPTMGDRIRILSTPDTESGGYAGREGLCYGFTTPSITGIEVVGTGTEDLAFNVSFIEDGSDEVWFSPECVTVIDHSPGLTATVGDSEFVRTADGAWHSVSPESPASRTQRLWERLRRQ